MTMKILRTAWTSALIGALGLLLALPVQAADFQSVASIRAAALSTLDPATEAEPAKWRQHAGW